MRRFDRLQNILKLDPEADCVDIYRQLVTLEFPWDFTRSLELALYRTYAIPSIGRLLAQTGEFGQRAQKRYDDTSLLLDATLEHGFDSERGRTALRRINAMHRAYDISNDDMRYVLCTFVVMPVRWIEEYGWRRLTDHELRACVAYYRQLGARMGIKDTWETYAEYSDFLDAYEAEHYVFDPDARSVGDATLDLLVSWGPRFAAPLVRSGARALMDDALLRAFDYPAAPAALRAGARAALKLRARTQRLLPPRRTPRWGRQNPLIKTCPAAKTDEHDVAALGTFPVPGERGARPANAAGACPVAHDA